MPLTVPDTEDSGAAVASYLDPATRNPPMAAKASMSVAVDANPELEAALRRASARTGVPLESARAFPDEVKKQAALGAHDYDEMARQYPSTLKFLSNVDDARLAHDDIDNLTSTEATVGPIRGARAGIGSVISGLFKSLPQGAEMARQGIRMQFADLYDSMGLFNPETNARVRLDAQQKYSLANLQLETSTPEFQSSTGQAVYGGASSFVRNIPGLLGSIATRSTAPMLATMGVQTEAEAYGKYRGRGATAGQAALGAVGEGVTEVATEMLPMSFLVHNLGRTGMGHFLTGLAAREIPSEQIATLVQDAIDTAVANPGKTWAEYAAERPGAAYQTLVATVTQAGILGGVHGVASRAQRRAMGAQTAEGYGAALDQFNTLATASKLRERDASTAQAFFQTLMDEGRDSVWITPSALGQSGMADTIAQAIPSVAAQLQQSQAMGTDIQIPIAELMAKVAGPELAQSVIPHLADEPGGFTRTTAAEYMQSEHAKQLQTDIQQTLDAKVGDDAFKASRDTVTAQVMDQLKTAGRFTDDVNGAYASMMGNFYAVQAARLGTTPEEMATRYPLQVRAESMVGPKTLDQTARTIEVDGVRRPIENSKGQPVALNFTEQKAFYDWFNDSKVVDESGKPLVLYHGTAADFTEFRKTTSGEFGPGIYFTDNSREAGEYGDGKQVSGARVIPAYLTLQHPYTDSVDKFWQDFGKNDGDAAAVQRAIDAGYDGVIAKRADRYYDNATKTFIDTGNKLTHYVAFDPRQIKSATGNDGTFDINDPSILSQGRRGSISFGDDITKQPSVITLLAKADLSTFLHESGHFFLEVMNDIASRADAPAEVKTDMDAALAWFGVPDLATWNSYDLEQKRPFHEQFARGFEAYLFEGQAPNAELQGLFSRFRAWLLHVYKNLTALNVNLTDEVRGVFDRMLATTETIQDTERAQGFENLFATKPAFMTDAEWMAYQNLSLEATQDAVRQLEARSLRDMQWLSNAKSKLIAKMQRAADEKRASVRAEVEAEVTAEPVNRARTFLKKGEVEGQAVEGGFKLSIAEIDELYKDNPAVGAIKTALGYGKYGMLGSENGIHPEQVAEMFGFASGDELVRALIGAENAQEKINGITDQRMLERYGDLVDEQSIARAADEALHNDIRLRAIATELNALNKAQGKKPVLAKAAKAYAEQAIARIAVGKLRPDLYTAAAKRSAKAADEAMKKDDLPLATVEKQNQLINSYAAKAALDARAEMEKTLARFKQIANGNNETVGKTRDMDMVHATRAILAEYGVGRKGKKASEYLKSVDAYDPGMAAVLRDRIDATTENAAPFKELTVEQVRGLRDEIESLWFLARRSRQMEVDGDLLDRQDIQDQLRARLDEIGVPEVVPGEGRAITPGEVKLSMMQSLRASMRRVEAWAGAKDGLVAMGPFRKFIWNTVKDPADAYRVDKAKYLKQLRALLDPIAPSLTQVKIAAPEIGYTFGFDKGGMGKVELLHALLHTGNESNKRKLLLGRRWGVERADGSFDTSKWDAFISRMIDEGRITKADFDFAQGVWDLLESIKPLAQKAHRDVFGRYFDEVTADPFMTPFGEYRGGYVPAMADSRIVSDAKTRALMEEENSTLMNVLPSTSKGFTKSRVEYNKPLLLDLRVLAQHIDKVLLFAHLEQPIRDVRRILSSNTVAHPLNRIDPAAFDGLITPWLNRAARQQVETPISGSNGLMRFFTVVRSRAGMAAMFANVSNALQQVAGFSIAAVRVPPRHLLSAAADFILAPKQMAQAVAEASPYMANRMENEVGAMTDAINDILLDPSVYEKAQAWTAKHTYFIQSAVDNVMGPIIWHGAYNSALESAPAGMTDEQLKTYARRLADSAVRETQGSTLPEDVSRIETGNAFVRMFTQFAGYFNMQANVLGTEFAKVTHEMGLRQGLGRGLYVMMFGFLVPAWAAQAIALALRGGPDDDNKDGNYLDDWVAQVFGWGVLRNATAMVPVMGQTVNALANTANNKPYDDKITTAPAISMIESAVSAPASVYKVATGKGSDAKAVRDVATLVTLLTGLPASAVARPIAYAADVSAGKAKPLGPADAARGAITGSPGPQSKR